MKCLLFIILLLDIYIRLQIQWIQIYVISLEATNEALEILERTKSIKKIGMVLIENYIVKSLFKIDTQDIV